MPQLNDDDLKFLEFEQPCLVTITAVFDGWFTIVVKDGVIKSDDIGVEYNMRRWINPLGFVDVAWDYGSEDDWHLHFETYWMRGARCPLVDAMEGSRYHETNNESSS